MFLRCVSLTPNETAIIFEGRYSFVYFMNLANSSVCSRGFACFIKTVASATYVLSLYPLYVYFHTFTKCISMAENIYLFRIRVVPAYRMSRWIMLDTSFVISMKFPKFSCELAVSDQYPHFCSVHVFSCTLSKLQIAPWKSSQIS